MLQGRMEVDMEALRSHGGSAAGNSNSGSSNVRRMLQACLLSVLRL